MPPVRLPQRRYAPDYCTQPFTACMVVDYIYTTGAETHRRKFLGAHISQPIVFDYFHCGGSENSLLECRRGIGRVCQHSADVSVVCSKSILWLVKKAVIYYIMYTYQSVQKSIHSSA